MELEGASAVVTGGASGIGEASARRLALLGAKAMVFVASFTAFVVLFSGFARPTGPRRV